MEKRRGTRPASSEEQECWSQAAKSLKTLSGIYSNPLGVQTIDRVNRLISVWPEDDTVPAEGLDSVKTTYTRLVAGLKEIQSAAHVESKAIEEAMERLDVVTALRKASEALPPPEKRAKRPRAPSPSVIPIPPMSTPASRSVSITLPARGSAGPGQLFPHLPKNRRDVLLKQLPLHPGRQVAFLLPPAKSNPGEIDKPVENAWILAVITKCVSAEKHKYEVKDPDPDPGEDEKIYPATLKTILPLPDPQAPVGSPSHLDACPEFPAGSSVLALYPDTTSFYRATVLATPKELHNTRGVPSSKYVPTYRLKFEEEEDENLEQSIAAHLVADWPEWMSPGLSR